MPPLAELLLHHYHYLEQRILLEGYSLPNITRVIPFKNFSNFFVSTLQFTMEH